MSKITLYRWVSLLGYFALLLLILNWFTWIAPPEKFPRSIVLFLLSAPLLIPLRGLLHGKRRTHQWVIFLSLAYFIGGVDVWFNQVGTRSYLGAAMTLFSVVLFVGCSGFGKHAGPPREPRKEKKARLAREAAEAGSTSAKANATAEN